MKTPEDFKKAAELKKITFWLVHNCSICEYPCGYIIRNNDVLYDSGCYCVNYINEQPTSWEDLAGFYNMQKYPDYIEEMNKFWGF